MNFPFVQSSPSHTFLVLRAGYRILSNVRLMAFAERKGPLTSLQLGRQVYDEQIDHCDHVYSDLHFMMQIMYSQTVKIPALPNSIMFECICISVHVPGRQCSEDMVTASFGPYFYYPTFCIFSTRIVSLNKQGFESGGFLELLP